MGSSSLSFDAAPRFRVIRVIGQGGFGAVYEAEDLQRDRRVALKRLLHMDASALLRFKREFRSLADVSHPHLVRLGELIAEQDEWYFSMELVDGVDLLSYIRHSGTSPSPASASISPASFRSGFDERRLREAFSQLAEGLQALHAAGMLHRDLKPSNVMVTREGRVVILDFGLVTTLGPEDSTKSTTIVGTPAYMSPEQGEGGTVSTSSDWYAVGIMLFEALTGRLPFEGNFYQVLHARHESEAPVARETAPGIPGDLNELCRALLTRDPGLRPTGEEVIAHLRPVPGPVAVADRTPSTGPFVGRGRELATLQSALDSVREGTVATAYVKAPSGMGKSALVRRFLSTVEETPDVLVLAGRCYQRESVPYKALDTVVDSLCQYLSQLPAVELARMLPRDWSALVRLFPVLQSLQDRPRIGRRAGVNEPQDVRELRRRGFAALRELLARLGDHQTVILFIDDLQWGDVDSGLLLRELLRPPDPPVLLLLGCYRSDEVESSPLLRVIEEGGRAEGVHHVIDLDVLTFEEARDLALASVGWGDEATRRLAEALARESGGNPLFVDQLVRHHETLPLDGIEQIRLESVIEARLEGVPDSSRRLLDVIAVAGHPLQLELANQAAGLDPHDTAPVDLLRTAQWVRSRVGDRGERFETYHDRVRQTVVGLLPPEVLPSIHGRLATALEASGVADPEALAEHYLNAGDNELAARHSLRAADQAAAALAFDRAARLYQMGLELWEPPGIDAKRALRRRLADALANANRGEEAAKAYLLAASDAAPRETLDLKRRAGEQFLISGLIDEGLEVIGQVLTMVGMKLAPTPRRALLDLILRRVHLRMRGLGFDHNRPSEIPPDVLTRIDVCWSVTVGLAMVEVIQSARFQAVNLLLALRAGDPLRVTRALGMELIFESVGTKRSASRISALSDRLTALVDELNEPYTTGWFAIVEGIIAGLQGRFSKSLTACEAGEAMLRERCTGVTWEVMTARLYQLHALVMTGRWKELAISAPAQLEEGKARKDNYLTTYIRTRSLFLVHLAQDDPDTARELQRHSLDGWSRMGFQVQHYWDWYVTTEIELYAGNPAAAWENLTRRWRAYQTSLLPRTQGLHIETLHLRARTAISLAAHDALASSVDGGGDRLLRRAEADLKWVDGRDETWAHAMAALARAGILSVRGMRSEAIGLLTEAENQFESIDMKHYAAAARFQRGVLTSGSTDPLCLEAGEWMAGQEILNPGRMAAMLAPGRWVYPG